MECFEDQIYELSQGVEEAEPEDKLAPNHNSTHRANDTHFVQIPNKRPRSDHHHVTEVGQRMANRVY